MECIPRYTQLLMTCARSLGGEGATMLMRISRCQKLLSRRCGIWGRSLSIKVCLVVPFFEIHSVTIVQVKRTAGPVMAKQKKKDGYYS